MDQPLEAERRSVRRVGGNTIGPVELGVETLGLSLPASVRDISVKGIGLRADSRLETGTRLTIHRRGARHGLASPLTGEVRQVTSLPDGAWLLGCSFSRLLTVGDMLELG
jgi:hypothetical protein